jgi:AcrR family transcriptional regulator
MRGRILDAAIECFVAEGYEATTMEAIAERADVARATVFNHYADKVQLLGAYLARRRAQLVELLQAEARASTAAVQQLFDAFDLMARVNEQNPAEARELVRAWWRTGGSTADAPDTGLILAEAIAAGQRRGELRAGIDAELAGRLLLDAYAGIVLRWVGPDEPPFSLRDAMRDVCAIVVDGLRVDAPAGAPGERMQPRVS